MRWQKLWWLSAILMFVLGLGVLSWVQFPVKAQVVEILLDANLTTQLLDPTINRWPVYETVAGMVRDDLCSRCGSTRCPPLETVTGMVQQKVEDPNLNYPEGDRYRTPLQDLVPKPYHMAVAIEPNGEMYFDLYNVGDTLTDHIFEEDVWDGTCDAPTVTPRPTFTPIPNTPTPPDDLCDPGDVEWANFCDLNGAGGDYGFCVHVCRGDYPSLGSLDNTASYLDATQLPLDTEVCLYDGTNFAGDEYCFRGNFPYGDLATYGWDNRTSSIIIRYSPPPPLVPIKTYPSSHDFGSVPVGSESTWVKFRVKNESDAAVNISSIDLVGGNPDDFAIAIGGTVQGQVLLTSPASSSPPWSEALCMFGTSLGPDMECDIFAQYDGQEVGLSSTEICVREEGGEETLASLVATGTTDEPGDDAIDLLPFFCPNCVTRREYCVRTNGVNCESLDDVPLSQNMRFRMNNGEHFFTYGSPIARANNRSGFYITKSGNVAEVFEEFLYDDSNIYHLVDTSWAYEEYPGHWVDFRCQDGADCYSTYLDGSFPPKEGEPKDYQPHLEDEGGIWVPRSMSVGDVVTSDVTVVAFDKRTRDPNVNNHCQLCQALSTGDSERMVELVSREENVTLPGIDGRQFQVIRLHNVGGPGAGENFWYALDMNPLDTGAVNPGWIGHGTSDDVSQVVYIADDVAGELFVPAYVTDPSGATPPSDPNSENTICTLPPIPQSPLEVRDNFNHDGLIASTSSNYLLLNGTLQMYNPVSDTVVESENLLADKSVGLITAFSYNFADLPVGVTATFRLSQDGTTWRRALTEGVITETATLTGEQTIELSELGWGAPSFYYRLVLTYAAGSGTPKLDSVMVSYLLPAGSTHIYLPLIVRE